MREKLKILYFVFLGTLLIFLVFFMLQPTSRGSYQSPNQGCATGCAVPWETNKR
jgi:hypothetical protein